MVIEKKVHEYLGSGSKMVWVANPDTQTVHVYEPMGVRILTTKNKIDGGATVLLVAPNVGGNFEQQVLDTGTFTAAAAWTPIPIRCALTQGPGSFAKATRSG